MSTASPPFTDCSCYFGLVSHARTTEGVKLVERWKITEWKPAFIVESDGYRERTWSSAGYRNTECVDGYWPMFTATRLSCPLSPHEYDLTVHCRMCFFHSERLLSLYDSSHNDEMSLPGLGLSEPEEVSTVETHQHDLTKECEWRFEVAVGKYVQVKVQPTNCALPFLHCPNFTNSTT